MDHRLSSKDLPRAQLLAAAVAILAVLLANLAAAASTTGVFSAQPVYLFGIPVDFILFGMTLLGVAVFHHKTLQVALTGLAVVTVYKLLFTGFRQGEGLSGLALQMQHEWVILANLFLLLMGFAILSRHFENFFVMYAIVGWHPDAPHKKRVEQDTRYQLTQTFLIQSSQRYPAVSKIGRRDAAFRDGLLAARVAGDGDAYS